MAYNQEIEVRIQNIIANWDNKSSKKMFGGTCHLLNGNMVCGVYKDFLILRLGGDKGIEALKSSHVKPFDITGKPMKGWVMVNQKGFQTENELENWLNLAREFVQTLPAK